MSGEAKAPHRCATLVEILKWRALNESTRLAYTFLTDGETEERSLTWGALERAARCIGACLVREGVAGERALLLYPPGLEYIAALFGCLCAGAVAVPVYPPEPTRLSRTGPRLEAIVADARPAVVLTLNALLPVREMVAGYAPGLQALRWIGTDGQDISDADASCPPPPSPRHLALLQYTSGSTGNPKGVMLSHENLLHNSTLICRTLGLTPESRGAAWLPPYHDMGLVGGLLSPLLGGSRVWLMPPVAFLQRPSRWLRLISKVGATFTAAPNFAYELCVRKVTSEERAQLDLSKLQVAGCGAEPVLPQTVERFSRAFSESGFRREAFYPCYGLAEATLMVSGGSISAAPVIRTFRRSALEANRAVPAQEDQPDAWSLVGCGNNMPDQKLLIVNPSSQTVCGPGEVGEIWISGPSVAQGYWNRQAESRDTFEAHLADSGEGPFLRTGDLGFLHDHELFVVGRLKDLLIFSGRNHHPQDIELTAQSAHPALRPGCGAAFSIEVDGEERLALVQEVDTRHQLDWQAVMGDVRVAVASEHQIDVHTLVLVAPGTIAKTSSGKIQRHACRNALLEGRLQVVDQWRAGRVGEEGRARPTPPDEASVAIAVAGELAAELEVEASTIDPARPLADYGVDSLRAVALAYRLENRLGIGLPAAALLGPPSISRLATEIAARLRAGQQAGGASEPAVEQDNSVLAASAAPEDTGEHPLSAGQQALWFLQCLAPQSTAYHIAHAARISSETDVSALERAFSALARRHGALRTTFGVHRGIPFQRVADAPPPDWLVVDDAPSSPQGLKTRLAEEAERPFDLERGPLMRVRIFDLQGKGKILLVVLHHIIADFWSLSLLVEELGMLYAAERAGRPAQLPQLAGCYSDYVRWQDRLLNSGGGERLWQYWRAKLADHLLPFELPTDHPRPTQQNFRGGELRWHLAPELTQRLRAVGEAHGATLFMTLLAAFQVLLYRHSGNEKVTVGTPAAGRSHSAWARVVGYFVNPVVICGDLSGNPRFIDLVARARSEALAALAHQDYPLPVLVERLRLPRNPGRPPLFQVMFSFLQAPVLRSEGLPALAAGARDTQLRLGDLRLEGIPIESRASQLDLALTLGEGPQGITGTWQYDSDLFERDSVSRMAEHFGRILEAVSTDPEQRIARIPLVSAEERQQVLIDWNATESEVAEQVCIHELFETQAARRPDAVAVVHGDSILTYGELNHEADRLAAHLQTLGVGPEVVVGICMERSPEMMIGLLGILKAGGAYLPLDPAYPRERLQLMVDRAGAAAIVTESRLRRRLSGGRSLRIVCPHARRGARRADRAGRCADRAKPDTLAYVIYTSGSTGEPKAVEVTHGALANRLGAMRERPGINPADVVMAITTLSFDIAAIELILPLLVGARVVLASREAAANGADLVQLLEGYGATVMQGTPTTWRLLLAAGWEGSKRLKALCGGETLPRDLANRLLERVGSLWNLYGPTEATIWSTVYCVAPGDGPVPIGRPIANTSVYLLDANLQPVPVGVPGDLYIGGKGLARGYRNRPDLTAASFVPSPFSDRPDARLYRTGDRARYLPDGNIDFLGRADRQVKLRGFRIEPEEIESTLRQHPALDDVVVERQTDNHGEERLVAYVTTKNAAPPSRRRLRSFLSARVPAHLIPSAFVHLERLPTTPGGKLNRSALPRPGPTPGTKSRRRRLQPAEQRLLDVWSRVLGTYDINLHDNFFDLGGNSLSAVRLAAEMSSAFGVELPVKFVFLHPTIETAAAAIRTLPRRQQKSIAHGAPQAVHSSPFLSFERRPLLSLFAAGKLPSVDAAAIAYLPDSLLSSGRVSKEEVIHDWCDDLPVFSGLHATIIGRIATVLLPRFTSQLYTDKEGLLRVIVEALELCGRIGARAVALTGLLPSATDYGHDVARKIAGRRLPEITTGHATTSATVVLTVGRLLAEAGRDIRDEHVAFLGLGSIGNTSLQLLLRCLPHPASLSLCDTYGKAEGLDRLRITIGKRLGFRGPVRTLAAHGGVPDELYEATLIVAATNVADLLDVGRLRSGTLIVDDSAPHCFHPARAAERLEKWQDLLFTEGGVLMAPSPIHQVVYLPAAAEEAVDARRFLSPRDSRNITGCVLSSLLAVSEPALGATLGLVDVDTAYAHYQSLKRLAFQAAAPHCEDYTLSPSHIRTFRSRFGRRAVSFAADPGTRPEQTRAYPEAHLAAPARGQAAESTDKSRD